jgi:chromosome segregation ATPase
MIAKVSALTMELNLVRDERDRLRQWEQQIDIEKARELTNTIAERRALETEKAVAERRAVGNAAEAASLRNALNETTTRLATTATELQQLRNEVSIKQRTFDDELYAMKTQYTTEQSAWEKEKEQLIRTNEDTVQRAIMEARKQSDERANECENALQNLQEKYTVADERIKELTNELNTLRSHVVGPSRPSSRLGGTMINTNISGMNSVTGSRRGSVHERSRRGSVVGLVPPHSDGHDTMEREDTVSKTKAKPSSPVALGSFHPTLPQGTLVSETPRQLVNEGEVTRLMGSSSLSGQEMLGSQSLSLKNNLLLHHYPHAYSSSSLSPSHPVTKGLTESIDTINQGIPSLNVVLSSSSSASSSLEIAYAEIASLNGEVQTLRYTIQDLRTTITALQVQLSRSMASVTEANKLRTEAENRTREMELQSTLLRGQIDNHVETIHQLQQDIVTLKDTVQLDRSSHIAQQNTIHASYEQMLFNEQQQRKTTEDELVALRHNLTVAQRKATAYKDRLLRLYEMYKLMKGHVQIMDPHLLLLEENK